MPESESPAPDSAKMGKSFLKRKWTSNLVILIGVMLLFWTGISQIVSYFEIQAAEADFARQLDELVQDTPTPAPSLPPDITPTVAPTDDPALPSPTAAPTAAPTAKPKPKPTIPPLSDFQLLGTLTIEKMGLSVPVVEGTGTDELHVGVGHIPYTPQVGSLGNACLAGHRRGVAAKPFARLDRLKEGDPVRFFDGKTTYTYIVYRSFIVNADDTWVLHAVPGVDYNLTLISCYYPLFGPTQRIIVWARLEGT